MIALLVSFAGGCSEESEAPVDVTPRVKCFVVGEQAVGQIRRISGKVVAADSSPLSFGVAGTVDQVLVSQGDVVRAGQILAALDKQPIALSVEQARGQVVIAREDVVESQRRFDQLTALVREDAATQLDLDSATTTLASAKAKLRSVQADLDRKEIDLKRAELIAPTAGTIAERNIEPFQEVTPGGVAFVLQASGSFKVEVRVPETFIRDVSHGQVVQVTFPTLEDTMVPGNVSTIGALAESGNAFPVDIRLASTEADLRAGMTATVTFQFSDYLEGRTVYMIPLSAIAVEVASHRGDPEANEQRERKRAPIYVFNESEGIVELREVQVGDLRGNMVEVFEGLEPGDKVVTAGVAFLRDGMKAELWQTDRGLSD